MVCRVIDCEAQMLAERLYYLIVIGCHGQQLGRANTKELQTAEKQNVYTNQQ